MRGIQPWPVSLCDCNRKARQHTTSVLHGPALSRHHVLLDVAAAKVVNVSWFVGLASECTSRVGELLSLEDVEVVVCGVAASVAFCPYGSPEDDKVSVRLAVVHRHQVCSLGDASVDDEHAAHGATGIVEHPFLWVRVLGRDCVRVSFGQLGDDGLNNVSGVGSS